VLHAVWHWREEWAQSLDVPPFKVTGNELLMRIAEGAEEGHSAESMMKSIHLGKRHERLAPSLRKAIENGLARDPQTLPRRRGRSSDQQPLTGDELALQDRLKADRDRIANQIQIDPTLIANRSQLAQIARFPTKLDEILLGWQADLLRKEPSLKQGETPPSSPFPA
jgi:ribonuclease D